MNNYINIAISNLTIFLVLGISIAVLTLLIKKHTRKPVSRNNNRIKRIAKERDPAQSKVDKNSGHDLYEFYKDSDKQEVRGRNYSEDLMDRGDAYVARTHLMSPSERDVFKVLEKAYGDRYYIFPQVRVVDLIQPNMKKYHSKSKEYSSLFRQISQWHFDYVLCHREDFRFFCALELDDPSHERPDRMKRDRIIEAACKSGGLALRRIKVNHFEKRIDLVKSI